MVSSIGTMILIISVEDFGHTHIHIVIFMKKNRLLFFMAIYFTEDLIKFKPIHYHGKRMNQKIENEHPDRNSVCSIMTLLTVQ
ncbi:hypothetical protein GCM10027043_22030 [Ferruginibacter profundus]